jgi:hypothetical protein
VLVDHDRGIGAIIHAGPCANPARDPKQPPHLAWEAIANPATPGVRQGYMLLETRTPEGPTRNLTQFDEGGLNAVYV